MNLSSWCDRNVILYNELHKKVEKIL
eukprot:SAG31_NODE_17195_length_679_cov_1.406897_1_plen_25_part_10